MAFLTPEMLHEKPVIDVHKAMFKDLVAMQRKSGTRDVYFVAVQGLPLKAGKKTSLLIVAPTRSAIGDWYERFHASDPKPKLLAQGTCAFGKSSEAGHVAIEFKKINGASRKFLIDAMVKGLAKDPRFTVRDAQAHASGGHHEGDEAEDEGHH